jgi:hypothetical protein
MVATLPISASTKILEETPFLKAKTTDLQRDPSYVSGIVSHLSTNERKRLRRLYNAFPESKDLGFIRTNCYGLGPDSPFCGVFEQLSRVNHSCRPNAERCWDADREVETLYALRDIPVGEELTVSYLCGTGEMARDERRDLLRKGWRFECNCECCSLTDVALSKSNERRRFIGAVCWEVANSFPAKLHNVRATMAYEYAELESIRGMLLADICLQGYKSALCLRDLEDAKKWIARYHSEYLLSTGPSSSWTRKALELMNKPTEHVAWNPLRSEVTLSVPR